jgi:uncharacterized protein (TIGR02217 family)
MAFRDVRMPERIERSFSGLPKYNVTITESASMNEVRNLNSPLPRYEFSCSLAMNSEQEKHDMLSFWHGVRGTWDSFRYRDWSDYYAGMKWIVNGSNQEELVHSDGDGSPVLPEVFSLGTGSTDTQHQLTKTYAFGPLLFIRKITKPVSGAKVWVETAVGSGVFAERTTIVSLNLVTGIVTFPSSAPASGLKIAWSGLFDVAVRFDSASFDFDFVNSGSMAATLKEVYE